jgi:aminoglycoside phosphotransferase (APT) family kinase protein
VATDPGAAPDLTDDAALAERLLQVMRAMTGEAGLAYAGAPRRLHGGFWAVLLAFSLTQPPPGWPPDLVARVMPEPGPALKESVVQAALAADGFPTPAVRLWSGPECGLGRAFMIMDRAGGGPMLPGLGGPAAIVAAARALWRIPEVLAAVMAELHGKDPGPIRAQLEQGGVQATVADMLRFLRDGAAAAGRADLTDAAGWLTGNPPPPSPEVVCHGDLHPFNLLVDGDRVTVLDWSVAMLAPRAFDLAFTSLMLSELPLTVPAPVRAALRVAGRAAAGSFLRRYRHHAQVKVDPAEVRWYQAVVSLRALTEVAGWVHDGTDLRPGHPWLTLGPSLAAHLGSVTGIPVRPR